MSSRSATLMQKFPWHLSLLHEWLKIFPMTQFTNQHQRSPNSCWLAKQALGLQDTDDLLQLISLTGNNYTGHQPSPQENLPESLQPPTQVRSVHPLLSPPTPPSQVLPQPGYSSSSSIYNTCLKMPSKAVLPTGSFPGCFS